MAGTVALIMTLALVGSGRSPAPPAKDKNPPTDPGRPLHSHSGRPFFSTGLDRSLISTGQDRGLASVGTDRGLISTGRDRGLISTGTGRPFASVGQDRALMPTGGLDAAPVADPRTAGVTTTQSSPVPGVMTAATSAAAMTVASARNEDPAHARFAGMMHEAEHAMQSRQFALAEQILYSVRGAEPQSWEARFRYATSLLALGRYDRSLDELATGMRLRPKDLALPDMAFGSSEVRAEIVKQLREYRDQNPADAHATLLDAALAGWPGGSEASTKLIAEVRANHPGWEMIAVLEAALAAPTSARAVSASGQ